MDNDFDRRAAGVDPVELLSYVESLGCYRDAECHDRDRYWVRCVPPTGGLLVLPRSREYPHYGHFVRKAIEKCKRIDGRPAEVVLAVLLSPPMTPEEADAAYDAAEPIELPPERIKAIVEWVVGGGGGRGPGGEPS